MCAGPIQPVRIVESCLSISEKIARVSRWPLPLSNYPRSQSKRADERSAGTATQAGVWRHRRKCSGSKHEQSPPNHSFCIDEAAYDPDTRDTQGEARRRLESRGPTRSRPKNEPTEFSPYLESMSVTPILRAVKPTGSGTAAGRKCRRRGKGGLRTSLRPRHSRRT